MKSAFFLYVMSFFLVASSAGAIGVPTVHNKDNTDVPSGAVPKASESSFLPGVYFETGVGGGFSWFRPKTFGDISPNSSYNSIFMKNYKNQTGPSSAVALFPRDKAYPYATRGLVASLGVGYDHQIKDKPFLPGLFANFGIQPGMLHVPMNKVLMKEGEGAFPTGQTSKSFARSRAFFNVGVKFGFLLKGPEIYAKLGMGIHNFGLKNSAFAYYTEKSNGDKGKRASNMWLKSFLVGAGVLVPVDKCWAIGLSLDWYFISKGKHKFGNLYDPKLHLRFGGSNIFNSMFTIQYRLN